MGLPISLHARAVYDAIQQYPWWESNPRPQTLGVLHAYPLHLRDNLPIILPVVFKKANQFILVFSGFNLRHP